MYRIFFQKTYCPVPFFYSNWTYRSRRRVLIILKTNIPMRLSIFWHRQVICVLSFMNSWSFFACALYVCGWYEYRMAYRGLRALFVVYHKGLQMPTYNEELNNTPRGYNLIYCAQDISKQMRKYDAVWCLTNFDIFFSLILGFVCLFRWNRFFGSLIVSHFFCYSMNISSRFEASSIEYTLNKKMRM